MLMSFAVCSLTCCGTLFIFGAYSKLWRFFHKRDYLSCINGVVFGFLAAGIIVYIIRKDVPAMFPAVQAADHPGRSVPFQIPVQRELRHLLKDKLRGGQKTYHDRRRRSDLPHDTH